MKTIHSRSNKNIGDVIEGQEITAKKVIAEPSPGDGNRPPRFGIYEYEVKATSAPAPTKQSRAKATKEPSVGGTRREASSGPMIVRRTA